MKYFTLFALVAILASFTFTNIEAACAAQSVYDTCIGQRQAVIDACGATNYPCLCQGYKDKQACYAQCPNDATAQSAAQSNSGLTTTFCVAASTTSTTPTATATASLSPATASNASSPSTSSGSSSSSSSSASPSSSSKSDANLIHIAKVLVIVPAFVAAALF